MSAIARRLRSAMTAIASLDGMAENAGMMADDTLQVPTQ
jgi:hypothetical protein